jgi:hypothetical protein
MRICLVGTLVSDFIYPLRGKRTKAYGGIYHSLLTLSALSSTRDCIIPVTYIGTDRWENFRQFASQHRNICADGLVFNEQKTNQSILRYFSDSERIEFSKYPYGPLKYEHIEPFLDCDLLAINMISGWDIDSDVLFKVRENYNGEIYMDIHNYLTRLDKKGQRLNRKPRDVEHWLHVADIVQMNSREFSIINTQNLDITDFCIKYCISERKLINLTRGAAGSQSVLCDQGKTKSYIKNLPQNKNACDPTGCGDAYMAGFIYGHLSRKDIDFALNMANCVASIYCEFPGAPDINELRANVRQRCLI